MPAGGIDTTIHRNPVFYTLKETKYKDILINYLGKVIKPTPELIDLKNHNYITIEDRQYRNQLIVQWTGIIFALITAIIAIIITIKSNNEKTEYNIYDFHNPYYNNSLFDNDDTHESGY